jgi:hypothetical protein
VVAWQHASPGGTGSIGHGQGSARAVVGRCQRSRRQCDEPDSDPDAGAVIDGISDQTLRFSNADSRPGRKPDADSDRESQPDTSPSSDPDTVSSSDPDAVSSSDPHADPDSDSDPNTQPNGKLRVQPVQPSSRAGGLL